MKKIGLVVVIIVLIVISCLFFVLDRREERSSYSNVDSFGISEKINILHTIVFVEKANQKAGIEQPESVEKQKEIFTSLMHCLEKREELWESSVIVADDICSLLYVDAFFGKEHHDFLVDKLSLYVYEEGLLSVYKKSTDHVPEDEVISSVQSTAYNLNFLSKVLSDEELKQFGFQEAIIYYFNYYLPEASKMDGEQKDETVSAMRGMYSEIICVMHNLGLENKLDFKPLQDLQQQKSRRNFEERYAGNTLYNASLWAMVAMEEHVYNDSNKYDAYANKTFCNLKTEADFYHKDSRSPFMELRFYILNGGDVSGNEFYSTHINEWLDEEIMTLYHQMMGNK